MKRSRRNVLGRRRSPREQESPAATRPGAGAEAPAEPAAPRVTLIDYTEKDFTERPVKSAEECLPFRHANSVTWVNVDGLQDPKLL